MKRKLRKVCAAVASLAVAASSTVTGIAANAAYGVGGNGKAIMEYLDRGIYAVKSGSGMFVSWRWNADDADDAEFRLYRDNTLIYTSKKGDPTSYQDNGGGTGSKYRVDCVENGKVVNSQNCKFTSGNNYFDIKLNRPGSQYSPNDACVGDVDGDGQYEIFLKWDPSNSKDNSQEGKTDDVIIDCYTLEGKQLWRINLGKNIRAGQHYTQMCVADFDCDGKAELITKTADGTKDGKGNVIGDGSKDYRNGKGYVLDGPEYMTLFDGQTGAALDTINFPVPRGKVSDWGDNYGNRVDRMNSGIAYLVGVHPTDIYGRGYYTRLTWSAVDVKNKKLSVRWIYDSTFNRNTAGWGCGNHNVMVADCDNDGKQEVFTGANCIDDNGKLLWTSGNLHGDAMHVGDLIPDREGLEVWECHEDKPYGESCYDAKTGKVIFHINNSKDTGRCAADNVWAGNKGAEFWGAADGNVYNSAGKKIGGTRPAQNFFIYWDGDLEREILDGTKITKMTDANTVKGIFTANGCGSNNSSKSVPCLTADLFGDWREELIMRTDDNSKLRVWCTTSTTKVRLTTLMHDMQYRAQNCCQQSSYNQPPHVSYYLGSDATLPERPKVLLNNTPIKSDTPAEPVETPTEALQTPTEAPQSGEQNNGSYSKKFDLGANAQSGFISVSASDKYDKNKGYGFSGNDVKNVAAAGKNELSDAVEFTGNTNFNADVPNGLYKVKVTLGNTARTSVYMEDMLQIVNMTGNNAVDEIILPVTDGQLNIRAAAGKSGNAFTISAIEINKISDSTSMPSTIWLCGDSTVCNYYPLSSSTQAGWGQMLGNYVDKNWYIRNMAASGEYAKGFVDHGNFDCIEKYGKSGDVFVISIGINDSKYYDNSEYKKVVTDMVKRAKAKGMDVILVKQQGRKGDSQLNPLLKSRYFSNELDQIASEQGCQIVDLFTLWQDYCVSVGGTKADSMYIDNVHPNREGADKLAELFASKFGKTTPVEQPTQAPAQPAQTSGKLIKDLTVNDDTTRADWSVVNSSSTGSLIYGDRDFTYSSLPSVLNGAEAVKTACNSKNSTGDLGKFTAGTDIDVYILLDQRVEAADKIPDWIKSWQKTGLTADSSNDVTFDLYKKTYRSGETVTLGTNGMNGNVINYTVFAKEAEQQTAQPTEAPQPTQAPQPTEAAQPSGNYVPGDANCDGRVDVSDAVAILQYIANSQKYPLSQQGVINADVSGHGDGVTGSDAISIQRYDARVISSLPED